MANWPEGNMDLPCEKCGAVHVVRYTDSPWKDRSRIMCLVPECGGVVIDSKSSRDWHDATLKEAPHA